VAINLINFFKKMYEEMLKQIKKLKKGDRFLVTITAEDKKNNNLKTSMFMDNFLFADLGGTKEAIIGLIDNTK
jgi:hypothetical protein